MAEQKAATSDDESIEHVSVLIVGAGPTALGAATRLQQQKCPSFLLVEANDCAGGLASSVCTTEGFWFDLGGHVIFSHYQYFDDVLQHCVGRFEETCWAIHARESFVLMNGTYVPYPFQLNFGLVPNLDIRVDCLKGLMDVYYERRLRQEQGLTDNESNLQSFEDWILASMGKGIHRHFMEPYNFKVWAYPTAELSWTWLGERVATVDLDAALRNCLKHAHERDEQEESTKWGPNSTFAFPQHGGTGSIWKAVADKAIAKERQRYGLRMTGLDAKRKVATFHDGSKIRYDHLITTIPLDVTLRYVSKPDLADRLCYSSTHVVGVGIRGPCPHGTKCWLYFPEELCNFYRCTIFSNYAEANCPRNDMELPTLFAACNVPDSDTNVEVKGECKPGPYHSLMFEISSSKKHKPVDNETVVAETIRGAVRVGLISVEDEIVSVFHRRLERGYPTPFLQRDEVLDEALPLLCQHNIYSRGRFGSWKYEVSNQDHSFMLGVEAADHILSGSDEITLDDPNSINGTKGLKQTDKRYVPKEGPSRL